MPGLRTELKTLMLSTSTTFPTLHTHIMLQMTARVICSFFLFLCLSSYPHFSVATIMLNSVCHSCFFCWNHTQKVTILSFHSKGISGHNNELVLKLFMSPFLKHRSLAKKNDNTNKNKHAKHIKTAKNKIHDCCSYALWLL